MNIFIVLYFIAQSFMNVFMGWAFRTYVTVVKKAPWWDEYHTRKTCMFAQWVVH